MTPLLYKKDSSVWECLHEMGMEKVFWGLSFESESNSKFLFEESFMCVCVCVSSSRVWSVNLVSQFGAAAV